MANIQCQNCGYEARNQAKYCIRCGMPLEKQSHSRTFLVFAGAILGVILAAGLLGAGAVLFGDSSRAWIGGAPVATSSARARTETLPTARPAIPTASDLDEGQAGVSELSEGASPAPTTVATMTSEGMPAVSADDALYAVWRWEAFNDRFGNQIVPVGQAEHTITLSEDRTLTFAASCNLGEGTYEVARVGGSMRLRLLPDSLVSCTPQAANDDLSVIFQRDVSPEARASYRAQWELHVPAWQWYLDWLLGTDARAEEKVGYDLVVIKGSTTDPDEWWANVDGALTRWEMGADGLMALQRMSDGSIVETVSDAWVRDQDGREIFWGVDAYNHAVRWVRGQGAEEWHFTIAGFRREGYGPHEYIPLRQGLLQSEEFVPYELRDDGDTLVFELASGELIFTRSQR